MKKNSVLSLLFALVMTLTLYASGAAAMEGNGTEDSPLQIATPADLLEFGKRVTDGETDLCAELTANIDIADGDESWTITDTADTAYSAIGKRGDLWSDDSAAPYAGVFDGKGFTLKLKKITTITNERDNIALFHTIGAGGAVKNLDLDVNFSGYRTVAGVAAKNYGAIENVTVSADITASHNTTGYAAGIAGRNYGTIENAAVSGNIRGNYAGGIAGLNGCAFEGDVLVPGRIINCLNSAAVTGNRYIGGIAGSFLGEMSRCGNIGAVSGTSANGQIGGLLSIGVPGTLAQERFIVSDCYNAGKVQNNSVNAIYSALFGSSAQALFGWRDYDGEYEDFKVSNVFIYGDVPPASSLMCIVAVVSLSADDPDVTFYDIAQIFANTYYREDMSAKLFGVTSLNDPDGFGNKYVRSVIKSKTTEEFASAEMAALLNNGRTGANAPWEYIEGNDYPTLNPAPADEPVSNPYSGSGGGCDAGAALLLPAMTAAMALAIKRRKD
jgi:hypothetical protein